MTAPIRLSFNEGIFFTTVRIVANNSNAPQGSAIGTGFCFSYERDGMPQRTFIVTNRHMVQGFDNGTLSFHKSNNGKPSYEGPIDCFVDSWSKWFCHPDPNVDIAVLPTEDSILSNASADEEVFTQCVSSSHFLNDNMPHPLEEVFFVGYPDGLWDEAHALPIARRGITASFINQDYNGRPCFLIDASVFGGSSGSPVFLLSSKLSSREPGTISWGKRCYFIGVVAETQLTLAQTLKVNVPQQTLPAEHLNLGIVFKARTVIETIEAWKKSTEK